MPYSYPCFLQTALSELLKSKVNVIEWGPGACRFHGAPVNPIEHHFVVTPESLDAAREGLQSCGFEHVPPVKYRLRMLGWVGSQATWLKYTYRSGRLTLNQHVVLFSTEHISFNMSRVTYFPEDHLWRPDVIETFLSFLTATCSNHAPGDLLHNLVFREQLSCFVIYVVFGFKTHPKSYSESEPPDVTPEDEERAFKRVRELSWAKEDAWALSVMQDFIKGNINYGRLDGPWLELRSAGQMLASNDTKSTLRMSIEATLPSVVRDVEVK